jgi:hypothetical protein
MSVVTSMALGAAAAAVSCFAIMWLFIWFGHVIYPDDIHNLIAQAGILFIGPIGGLTVGALIYKRLRISH